MARKVRDSKLESRSARLKLPVRRKPYTGPSLSRGVMLLYRRNRTAGTWVVKASDGHGAYWTKAVGVADDYDDADGDKVLTFYDAKDKAKALSRGGAETGAAPITVDGALTDYASDLRARGADLYNARHPRVHLTATLLAKPVQLLTTQELRKWRDGLLAKLKPSTVNRVCNSLCAALELAAQHDKRIGNRDAWEVGLAGLPDAQEARNVVISDAKVSAFVDAAYARDDKLGLLVDTLAVTGARPSQAIRLRCEDLHATGQRPKLLMPRSAKGGGRNRAAKKVLRYSVPITPQLAKRLKAAAKGRPGEALLFVQSNGQPWNADPSLDYRRDVRAIVATAGLDPDKVTVYALRHSSIVRMLLKNVAIRLVASLHDTSTGQIERNYARFITEYADDYARPALLEHAPPAAADNNVIPIAR